MKKIKFTCSNCNAKLRVPTHLAGVSAPCPKCGSTITAPTDLENVVDESAEVRPAHRASTPRREVAVAASGSANGAQAAVASPAVAERAVAAPASEVPPVLDEAPPVTDATPEIPPPPSLPPMPTEEPVAEIPVVEETLFVDPPAPELPHTPENEVAAEAPVPAPPVPKPITPPPSAPAPYVEETPVETELAPPPPVPETQPIRVNPQPSHLPPVRGEEVDADGELPRLDVNLADQGASGPDSLARNPGATTGPTRVQLPQPGTEMESFSPDDFIVPTPAEFATEEPPPIEPSAEEVVVSEPAEVPDYLVPDELPVEEGIPLDEVEAPFLEQPYVEDSVEVSQGTGEYVPLELPPLETPPSADAVAETEPESNFIAEAAAAQEAISSDISSDVAQGDLHEGSMENMLSQQQEVVPAETPLDQMATAPVEPVMESQSPAAATAPPAGATEPVKSERDILDEMFGSAPSEEERKMSTKVLLSIMGGVALIAIIFVVVGIYVLGGGMNPSHGQGEAPAAPVVKDNKSGAKAAPEEVKEPAIPEPSIVDAPAIIDPVAQERVEKTATDASTVSLPGAMDQPVRIVDSSGAGASRSAVTAAQTAQAPVEDQDPPAIAEQPALSIDERVQQIVNGSSQSSGGGATLLGAAGSAPADPIESALADFGSNVEAQAREKVDALATDVASRIAGEKPGGNQAAEPVANYNPPASFPAPEEGLGRTHDLLDAFLRAPDWESRVKYVYQGESLRPAMEEYYKKYDMINYSRYSKQLFQMEADKELGGPYWVYLISTSDTEQGFPLIIREEEGLLKVDWEIFSEFEDRHFVQFQRGAIASPHTFRLVVERVSDYYGSDRDGFENLDDYYVYQVNPPYGDLNEFSDYAFVKADSEIARKLDEVVGLGEQPLAVIVTLSQEAFPHGVKHLVITDYVTEGWFR